MNWYYVEQGQQAGPVSDAQLDGMLRAGKIRLDTLVWREGMPAWVPYREVKGEPVPPSAPRSDAAEAVCVECGKMFPAAETIRYGESNVCATCKPVFLQKLREGANLHAGGLYYAGFWIRFAAKLVDGVILGVVVMVPAFVIIGIVAASAAHRAGTLHFGADLAPHAASGSDSFDLIGNVLMLFVQVVMAFFQIFYSAFFLGRYGATPGKMVCGLKVVDAEGNRIGYGRAFGRAFAELLSGMICDIGYIIAGFDNPQKRALHDHICNTRVVYKNG